MTTKKNTNQADYKKLIEDNASDFNDADTLQDFIDSYIDSDGDNLKDLEDYIHEFTDNNVPIYYNDIVKEWSENNACHGLTVEQTGEYGKKDIYGMMQEDLFFYTYQQLSEDYQALLDLLDSNICDICNQPEDDDGRCGCTNEDSK